MPKVGRPRKFDPPVEDPDAVEAPQPVVPMTLEDNPVALSHDADLQETRIPDIIKHVTRDAQKVKFLIAFSELGSRPRAAKIAGISVATVWQWLKSDKDFKAAFDKAREIMADLAEDELQRRATEGVIKPIFQQGKLVGGVREFSDTLLIKFLQAHRPNLYRETINQNHVIDVADRLTKARDRVFKRLPEGEDDK